MHWLKQLITWFQSISLSKFSEFSSNLLLFLPLSNFVRYSDDEMSYREGDSSYKAINFITHSSVYSFATVMLFTCCCDDTCSCQPITHQLSTDVGRQSSCMLKVVRQTSADKKVSRQIFDGRYCRRSEIFSAIAWNFNLVILYIHNNVIIIYLASRVLKLSPLQCYHIVSFARSKTYAQKPLPWNRTQNWLKKQRYGYYCQRNVAFKFKFTQVEPLGLPHVGNCQRYRR